jgi:hypothetical protein
MWAPLRNQRARHRYESEDWSDDNVERHDEIHGVVVPETRCRRRLAESTASPTAASKLNVQTSRRTARAPGAFERLSRSLWRS